MVEGGGKKKTGWWRDGESAQVMGCGVGWKKGTGGVRGGGWTSIYEYRSV